jgi:hypothetical protein
MHLSQICASPESMDVVAHFVLLSKDAKALKIGRYKLTDCPGIYFAGWMFRRAKQRKSGGEM